MKQLYRLLKIQPYKECVFVELQHYYNFIRPHEALNQKTPADIFHPSIRVQDGHLRSPEYNNINEKRRVMKCGCIGRQGKNIFISEILQGEYVGITEKTNRVFEVKQGPIILGSIDENKVFSTPHRVKRRQRK